MSVFTIALGVVLGCFIIMALPYVSKVAGEILGWCFDLLLALGDFIKKCWDLIKKCWQRVASLKWYYKIISFVGLEYLFFSLDWWICGTCVLFVGIYFVSYWIVDMLKKIF